MAAKLPLWLTTTAIFSSVSAPIIKNASDSIQSPNRTYHYFFRLPLFSSTNKEKTHLVDEDKARIEGYYKKYYSYPAFVNKITQYATSNMEGEGNPNFYIQVHKEKLEDHRELEWLKTVRLNQITVDRYYEKKSSDSELTSGNLFKELIKTENFLPQYTKSAQNALNQEAIDLYFKGVKIDQNEIKKLVYYPSESIGAKRWFVWLDKDLLRLKLNLGFHIWFFNQTNLQKHSSIRDLLEKEQTQKNEIKKKVKSLYKKLTEEEKNFFSLYYSSIWSNKQDKQSLAPQEISSEDINKIYNLLQEKGDKITIFKDHLLQVLEGGDKLGFESFFPNYITYASGPDALYALEGGNEFNSNVKVTITPDRRINSEWKVNEVLDLFKNYSIKNFTLRTTNSNKDQWPSLTFTNSPDKDYPIIREEYFVKNKVI
ncbi:hypothetical protein [Mycoplasma suis]|uniref:Uncharacterized protein n=1 Tax=Mycoplasma suis (strain Illinois) TaxID=768700 RepID=F0QS33_MYCSL|nr:hypothetical protein [Mycoplasma suis]ADX98303.1 Conserved hypothetical protein [Mycoplasma suis str. Illinois]